MRSLRWSHNSGRRRTSSHTSRRSPCRSPARSACRRHTPSPRTQGSSCGRRSTRNRRRSGSPDHRRTSSRTLRRSRRPSRHRPARRLRIASPRTRGSARCRRSMRSRPRPSSQFPAGISSGRTRRSPCPSRRHPPPHRGSGMPRTPEWLGCRTRTCSHRPCHTPCPGCISPRRCPRSRYRSRPRPCGRPHTRSRCSDGSACCTFRSSSPRRWRKLDQRRTSSRSRLHSPCRFRRRSWLRRHSASRRTRWSWRCRIPRRSRLPSGSRARRCTSWCTLHRSRCRSQSCPSGCSHSPPAGRGPRSDSTGPGCRLRRCRSPQAWGCHFRSSARRPRSPSLQRG